MDYEDDDYFSYMNSVITWVNELCGRFNNSPASMGGNVFNKFLNVPDFSGVPALFPHFPLTNSERNDLEIPPVHMGHLEILELVSGLHGYCINAA